MERGVRGAEPKNESEKRSVVHKGLLQCLAKVSRMAFSWELGYPFPFGTPKALPERAADKYCAISSALGTEIDVLSSTASLKLGIQQGSWGAQLLNSIPTLWYSTEFCGGERLLCLTDTILWQALCYVLQECMQKHLATFWPCFVSSVSAMVRMRRGNVRLWKVDIWWYHVRHSISRSVFRCILRSASPTSYDSFVNFPYPWDHFGICTAVPNMSGRYEYLDGFTSALLHLKVLAITFCLLTNGIMRRRNMLVGSTSLRSMLSATSGQS